jgi:two-component system CheB/CheR fusion protein
MWILMVISLALQCVAALQAVRLSRCALRRWVWLTAAAALSLMALRRATTLVNHLWAQDATPLDPMAETIALVISFLWVWGLFYAGPLVVTDQAGMDRLEQARVRLWEILANTGVGYLRLDRDGKVAEANEACSALHGFTSPEDLCGESYLELIDSRDRSTAREAFRRVLSGASIEPVEIRRRDGHGFEGAQRVCAAPVRVQEEIVGAEGIVLDTSRERRAMLSLQESEERFRRLYQQIPQGYQSQDAEGRILEVNDAWEEITGYTRKQATGRDFSDFVCPEAVSAYRAAMEQLRSGRRVRGLDMEIRCAQGICRFVLLDARASFDAQGQFEQAYCILTDVTELKETQRNLQASLEEKSLLLREVHHRVKNNLQLISSLLSLQVQRSSRQGLGDLLASTQSRVFSIALLHEALLDAGRLSRPDVPSYFSGIVDHLRNASNSDTGEIEFDLEIADASLTADQAMRCGLIVNELVSNALEHAFPAGSGGHVRLELKRRPNRTWALTVADDGCGGDPESWSSGSREGLGLELVDALCRQLGGKMKFLRNHGTQIMICFPESR